MIKYSVCILVGGLGTRLREVEPDLPKPLVDINGYPFLKYVIDNLLKSGVDEIVLLCAYKSELFYEFIDKWFLGHNIRIVVDEELHGTGGAVVSARESISNDYVVLLNGDTFFLIDLDSFVSLLETSPSGSSVMGICQVDDVGRYGQVVVNDDGRILCINEKGSSGRGFINAGIYGFSSKELYKFDANTELSFETDVLPKLIDQNCFAYSAVENFCDIGIPSDLEAFRNVEKTI